MAEDRDTPNSIAAAKAATRAATDLMEHHLCGERGRFFEDVLENLAAALSIAIRIEMDAIKPDLARTNDLEDHLREEKSELGQLLAAIRKWEDR